MTITTTLDRTRHYTMIGAMMRLHQEYDPRQLWLGFVVALIHQPATVVVVAPPARSAHAMQRLQARVYAEGWAGRRDPACLPHQHQRGVAQYRLPFVEERMVGDAEWVVLKDAGFPAWELLDGYPAALSVTSSRDGVEVRTWLLDNCRGRFRFSRTNRRAVRFERISDYAMAKLRFG